MVADSLSTGSRGTNRKHIFPTATLLFVDSLKKNIRIFHIMHYPNMLARYSQLGLPAVIKISSASTKRLPGRKLFPLKWGIFVCFLNRRKSEKNSLLRRLKLSFHSGIYSKTVTFTFLITYL